MSPIFDRMGATTLAVVLHVAVAGWWLNGASSVVPPHAPVQALTVSLISEEAPPRPQALALPKHLPVVKEASPKTARNPVLTTRNTTPANEIPAESVPGPSVPTHTASPSTSATSQSGPSAAITPPSFDAAYLNNPPPPYPGLSRRMGEMGRVLLNVRVGADGSPLEVEVAQSSGFPRLDTAARAAVLGWKFVPARQGEKAITASVKVPILFKLN